MRFTSVVVAGVLTCLVLAGAVAADPLSADELHTTLHLVPTQEPAWQAYQTAIRPDPVARTRQRATLMLLPTLSTPRRIDLLNAQMEAELAAMRRQGEAVKAFYATLTPAQQQAFDAATAPSADQPTPSAPLRRPPGG